MVRQTESDWSQTGGCPAGLANARRCPASCPIPVWAPAAIECRTHRPKPLLDHTSASSRKQGRPGALTPPMEAQPPISSPTFGGDRQLPFTPVGPASGPELGGDGYDSNRSPSGSADHPNAKRRKVNHGKQTLPGPGCTTPVLHETVDADDPCPASLLVLPPVPYDLRFQSALCSLRQAQHRAFVS